MLSVIMVSLLLLFMKNIIHLEEIKNTSINTLKGISIISIIMSIMGLYYNFNPSYMLYVLLLIYILSYTLNHPLVLLFDSFSRERFGNRPIFNLTPNKYRQTNVNKMVYNINRLYPDEIKVPFPTLRGDSITVDGTMDESIKKGIEDHYWIVNQEDIYNKELNTLDCKKNNSVPILQKKPFPFLDTFKENKNAVVGFIIFIIMLYVFMGNENTNIAL